MFRFEKVEIMATYIIENLKGFFRIKVEKIKEIRISYRRTINNILYIDREQCPKCGGIYIYDNFVVKGMTVCIECGFKTEIVKKPEKTEIVKKPEVIKKPEVEEIYWERDKDQQNFEHFILFALLEVVLIIWYIIAVVWVGFL